MLPAGVCATAANVTRSPGSAGVLGTSYPSDQCARLLAPPPPSCFPFQDITTSPHHTCRRVLLLSLPPSSLALPIDKSSKKPHKLRIRGKDRAVLPSKTLTFTDTGREPARIFRRLRRPSIGFDENPPVRATTTRQLLTCWHPDHHFSLLPTTNDGDLIHPLIAHPLVSRASSHTPSELPPPTART